MNRPRWESKLEQKKMILMWDLGKSTGVGDMRTFRIPLGIKLSQYKVNFLRNIVVEYKLDLLEYSLSDSSER